MDPDPEGQKSVDPDPEGPKSVDPDPNLNSDPQHCKKHCNIQIL
jgi:hypothetical protein